MKNVPLTMARCIVELSPAERFAIYDYTVARAKAANKTPSIKLADLQINFEKKDNGSECLAILFIFFLSTGTLIIK